MLNNELFEGNETEVMEGDVEMTEKVSIVTKVKSGIKKYGKPVAIGAAVLGATVLAYKLGNKTDRKVIDITDNTELIESGDSYDSIEESEE